MCVTKCKYLNPCISCRHLGRLRLVESCTAPQGPLVVPGAGVLSVDNKGNYQSHWDIDLCNLDPGPYDLDLYKRHLQVDECLQGNLRCDMIPKWASEVNWVCKARWAKWVSDARPEWLAVESVSIQHSPHLRHQQRAWSDTGHVTCSLRNHVVHLNSVTSSCFCCCSEEQILRHHRHHPRRSSSLALAVACTRLPLTDVTSSDVGSHVIRAMIYFSDSRDCRRVVEYTTQPRIGFSCSHVPAHVTLYFEHAHYFDLDTRHHSLESRVNLTLDVSRDNHSVCYFDRIVKVWLVDMVNEEQKSVKIVLGMLLGMHQHAGTYHLGNMGQTIRCAV